MANVEKLVVDSLALVGIAAATADIGGSLRATNQIFEKLTLASVTHGALGLRFKDRKDQAIFQAALTRCSAKSESIESIWLRLGETPSSHILHLINDQSRYSSLLYSQSILAILVDVSTRPVPSARLLREMFFLTPSEARVAQELIRGLTIADIANDFDISQATVRVHLRSILAKTSTSRQSELIQLLTTVAPPDIKQTRT